MNYRLIVIRSSLKDKSVLAKYKILSETKFEEGTPEESSMYKMEIPEDEVYNVSNFLKNNLNYPYYAHVYHEDPKNNTMIVVFAGQLFHTTKDHPKDAIAYGIQHGVTKEQMDMKPRNITDETW